MNTLSEVSRGLQSLVDAPAWALLLVKITLLLATAWAVHAMLAWANARWRVLLWRLTAIGVVALPAATWLPGLQVRLTAPSPSRATANVPAPQRPTHVDAPLPRGFSGDAANRPRAVPVERRDLPPRTDSDMVSVPKVSFESPEKPLTLSWPAALLAVWLGGIGIGILRLGIGQLRIGRLIGRAASAPQWVRDECRHVASRLGCGADVEVMQSASLTAPTLCGLFRPRLLLSQEACDEANRGDLASIFAHELAHVRAHDVRWNFGLHLLEIALWFHPLAWFVRRAHLAACDLVADAVSADFVGDVGEYCRALARVAVRVHGPAPSAGLAMARVSNITRRLRALRKRVFHAPLSRRNVVGFAATSLACIALIGVLRFAYAAPAAQPKSTAAQPAKKDAAPAAVPQNARTLRVRVLDPQGQPLSDANVLSSIWTEEKDFKHTRDYKTDTAGTATVELPKTYTIVRIWAGKPPLVSMYAGWEENELALGEKLPEEYTMRLESGAALGGRIVDQQQRPIAGAKVEVQMLGDLKPATGDGRVRYNTSLGYGTGPATTGANGRWRIENVPKVAAMRLGLRVTHTDFPPVSFWSGTDNAEDVPPASLRNETAVMTLKRGIAVAGRVTDPSGKPIKNATITRPDATDPGQLHEVSTDADGRYRLPPSLPGQETLTITAPDFAPQLLDVTIKEGMTSQDVRMTPGKPLELRFVDEAGKPLPNVSVRVGGNLVLAAVGFDSTLSTEKGVPRAADAQGIWLWKTAPEKSVRLGVYVQGFVAQELDAAGGGGPRTVVLKQSRRLAIRVNDAITGKPVQRFQVVPVSVFGNAISIAQRGMARAGKDGSLDLDLRFMSSGRSRLSVEATGYKTDLGPEFTVADTAHMIQDFRLQPSLPVTGVLLDVGGKPLAKAGVFIATATDHVDLRGGHDNPTATTDDDGRFTLSDPGVEFVLIAQSEAGFLKTDYAAGRHDLGSLQLQAWAVVRGQVRDGARAVPGATVTMSGQNPPGNIYVEMAHSTKTAADGRYEISRVPPGRVQVTLVLPSPTGEEASAYQYVPLAPQPGQQVELDFGAGATINGKLTLTGRVPPGIDWNRKQFASYAFFVSRKAEIATTSSGSEGGVPRPESLATWSHSMNVLEYTSERRMWRLDLLPGRPFRILGVPPGQYDFVLFRLAEAWPGDAAPVFAAETVVPVPVTAADAARGEMTLPDITAEVFARPLEGDTPSFSFQKADGSAGSLADYRGRYVLVQFWTSWSKDYARDLGEMRKLHEKFAGSGLTMLGLSLDDDAAAWQAAIKRLNLPWQQGRLRASGEAGFPNVPEYWLLDPSGKIVQRSPGMIEPLIEALPKLLKAEPLPRVAPGATQEAVDAVVPVALEVSGTNDLPPLKEDAKESKDERKPLALNVRIVGVDGKPTGERPVVLVWDKVTRPEITAHDTTWTDPRDGSIWRHLSGGLSQPHAEGTFWLLPGVYRVTAFVGDRQVPKMVGMAVSDAIRLDSSQGTTSVTVGVQDGPPVTFSVVDAATGRRFDILRRIRLTRPDGLDVQPDPTYFGLFAGSDGKFRIEHLAPGRYQVDVTAETSSFGYPNYEFGKPIAIDVEAGKANDFQLKMVAKPLDDAEAQKRWPWAVEGLVTDDAGRPMQGVEIRAATGIGTLKSTRPVTSDAQGHYLLRFGPGMMMQDNKTGKWGAGVQAADIFASKPKPGYVEKHLGRQGDLTMADEMPDEKQKWGNRAVILPGKPYRVDFVMVPAAVIEGRLIDDKGASLPNAAIRLTGDALPPASNILAAVSSDGDGRFRLDDVPPGFAWWLQQGIRRDEISRTQSFTLAQGQTYAMELRAGQDDSGNVLRIASVEDSQGNVVTEMVVGNDPRGRPLVDAATEAKAREILGRMAEANRFWFAGPAKDITGFSYTFHLTGQQSKEITYQDYLKGQSWYPEWYGKGISYTGAARVLASLRDQAKFRELTVGDKEISIYFVLRDLPSTVASGNGIAGTWRGFSQSRMQEGRIVLDAKRLTPNSIEYGESKERYSNYVEIHPAAYVPLSIDIAHRSMELHWKFRVWKAGLWLFDKTQDRPAADAAEPVAWTSDVTVNGQPAVAAENK